MPRSNRHRRDFDCFRVQIACPVCGARCRVRMSNQQTVVSRASYVNCVNPVCGWSGLAVTEIVRTISPASRFYDSKSAPPPVDGKYEQALIEDLK